MFLATADFLVVSFSQFVEKTKKKKQQIPAFVRLFFLSVFFSINSRNMFVLAIN